jgi:ParB family transcriptional regulator, chromosome partitioning protein
LRSGSPLLGVLEELDIAKIKPSSRNVRSISTHIDQLAYSISKVGLLEPIVVRTTKIYDLYDIVAGFRRYQACKKLGFKKISAHIVRLDDKEAFEVSLMENLDRKSLDPLEEAQAYKNYICDFGWGGVTQLASRLGRSASYVTKRMMLLELPQDVLNSIAANVLSVSNAEELLKIEDTHAQSSLARLINERHLTVKQARRLVNEAEADYISLFAYNNGNNGEDNDHNIRQAQKSFDNSISLFKIALNKMGSIIEDIEDNWIVYERLMHHKNMLNAEIDILLKEKKKYAFFSNRSGKRYQCLPRLVS